jgi:phosphatidylglycerophosphatase A
MAQPTRMDQTASRSVDRIAYAIATGAGAGFAPVAPGTVGAIEGVIIFLIFNAIANNSASLTPFWSISLLGAVNIAIFIVGVWASSRACEICSLEDPSQVVIDEVSGQLIALIPLIAAPSVAGILIAFALFRLFDIFKPYPIRKLERLRAGLGIMADDALAGIYAAALVWIGIQWRLI